MSTALDIRNASFRYRDGTEAVRGFSAVLATGECVALVGPNGAGKTTLTLMLAGFLEATAGEIFLCGDRMTRDNVAALRARAGFLFHDPDDQLFMPTLLEDVCFGLRNSGATPAAAVETARAMLAEFGLEHAANRFPGHLSAGQKRLATLAGVLVMKPELLVLDEPTALLDPHARRHVIDRLRVLPMTRLIVTHDLELVAELCPRVIVMSDGRNVADGHPGAILADAALMARHRLEVPASLRTFQAPPV
jgi:cobalt/nickel transport system ATP-binding protein